MKSNDQIRTDVIQQLRWNSDIEDAAILVAVEHNTVTLSGSVPSRENKKAALELAQKVQGVQRVVQNLKVVIRTQPIEST